MFHNDLQGDIGPPGPAGLTGLPGAGIQGEKVGDFFFHSDTSEYVAHSAWLTVIIDIFYFYLGSRRSKRSTWGQGYPRGGFTWTKGLL